MKKMATKKGVRCIEIPLLDPRHAKLLENSAVGEEIVVAHYAQSILGEDFIHLLVTRSPRLDAYTFVLLDWKAGQATLVFVDMENAKYAAQVLGEMQAAILAEAFVWENTKK